MNENESMMSDEKKIYEISFIFDNRLTEEKALDKAESLKKDIASFEGSFISEETPYMRELSYEMIRVVNNVNTRFTEGYFGWIKFEIAPSFIEEINKRLKLDEEIIRFLIVKTTKEDNIFTKDIPVMKADPTIAPSQKDDVLSINSDIDTTNQDDKEEDLDEEVKKDLEEEIQDL